MLEPVLRDGVVLLTEIEVRTAAQYDEVLRLNREVIGDAKSGAHCVEALDAPLIPTESISPS